MSNYHRAFVPGGCFFFTLITYKRHKYFADDNNVNRLREAFLHIKKKHPFTIDAITILPDHLHTIWQLPNGDTNYSLRWRLIKHFVATGIDTSINHRNEKQIWQRRFWEHVIRDERDWHNHIDYIHYNPVKHGYVTRPDIWKYSSFSHALNKGWYDANWGCSAPMNINGMDLE